MLEATSEKRLKRNISKQALGISDKRLRDITSALGEGVYVLDQDGRLTFMNPEAERLLGWTEAELLGKDMHKTVHYKKTDGSCLPAEDCPVLKVIKLGNACRSDDDVFIRRDGTVFPIAYVATPLMENGEVIGSVTAFRDITKRKRVEKALLASEERYRMLAETSHDAIYIIDREDRIHYINNFAAELLGLAPEDIVGRTRQEFFPPAISDQQRRNNQKVFESGEPSYVEDKIPFGDRDLWLGTWLIPVDSNAGKVDSILGISRDITDHKLAEEEIRRAKELSDALNRINTAINLTLNLNEIMQRIIVESSKAIGVDSAMIIMRELKHWEIKYVYGISNEVIGIKLTDEEAIATMRAVKARRPIITDNAFDEAKANKIATKYGTRSFLSVPLIIKEDVIGTLFFNCESSPATFTEAQLDFANKLSTSISLALENARLYEAEHRIAKVLQESLIQPFPSIPGIDIGVSYKPAFEAERVGGDFYDVFSLDENLVAVLVGDVSGKGIEAASLTETIRSTVRTLAYMDPSPSFVLNRANQALMRQIPDGGFATAIFLTLDIAADDIRIASAGHPLAVLCGSQECRFVDVSQGLPLGSFISSYAESFFKLSKDQGLLLYTDGLIEARRGSEFFGEARLLEAIAGLQTKDPNQVVDILLKSASDFAEGKLVDDIAIVAIRRSSI